MLKFFNQLKKHTPFDLYLSARSLSTPLREENDKNRIADVQELQCSTKISFEIKRCQPR